MNRVGLAALLLGLAVVLAACGNDPTGPRSPGVLRVVNGDGQTGKIDATLPERLIVEASEDGTPLAGREVQWRLVSSPGPGALLADSITTTDSEGLASASLTLGSVQGEYVVRASTDGGSVEFRAVAEPVDRRVEATAGSGQVGMTGANLPEPLVAVVTEDGNPAVGVTVRFEVVDGMGSLSTSTVTTDGAGLASASLTLGPRNGPVRVRASRGETSDEFQVWACGGDRQAASVSLAVSADTLIDGSGLGCIQFGSQVAGSIYEATIVNANPDLEFDDAMLFVRGVPVGGTAVRTERIAGGSPGGSSAAPTLRGPRLAPQYELDRRLRKLEQPLRPLIRAYAARSAPVLAAVPAVGDTLEYVFSCGDGAGTGGREITGVVRAVGEKGIVVEDTTGSTQFSEAEAAAIVANFDDVIFATDTTYFGPPGDIDGNGRVILLFTSAVNALADASPGGYDDGIVAGFFCPIDLGFAGGNNAEMFYLVAPDPTGAFTEAMDEGLDKQEVLTFVNGTVAHEFQHLVNAQTGSGGAFDVWLNEGLSHLAEEVVGHAATGFTAGSDLTLSNYDAVSDGIRLFNTYHVGNWYNLRAYLENPSDTAGLVMTKDPLGAQTFRMRGAAWSFLRYLLDRFVGRSGEAEATRALIADGSEDSRDAIEHVFGEPFGDLVDDWSVMPIVDDRNPLAPRPSLTLPSYRLRQMFMELGARSSSFPAGGLRLAYYVRGLDGDASLGLHLYSYAAGYLRLEALAGSGGTGIRIGRPDTAGDLPAASDFRLRLVRIR